MRSGTDFAEAEPGQEMEEPCERKKDITETKGLCEQ